MNARFSKLILSVGVIAALVLAAAPSVNACEVAPAPSWALRLDVPKYAQPGPYPVGMRNSAFDIAYADGLSRRTVASIWYPALATGEAGGVSPGLPPDEEHGPYPLVIFSQGWNGSPKTSSFLTAHLASWGTVVIEMGYWDHWTRIGPDYLLFTRARDVAWQLDHLATLAAEDEAFVGLIDMGRVAVVGYGLGGTTAFLAAGGKLDSGPDGWCAKHADLVLPPETMGHVTICPSAAYPNLVSEVENSDMAMAVLAGLDAAPQGLWPSWGDPRVNAIVALAPRTPFGPESLVDVTVPAMVLVGSQDRTIFSDDALYVPYAYENLGSATRSLVVFDGADHMIFRDRGIDPAWDVADAHDLINHFTTAFLLATLKDDADAAAALAPDAVQFPGITYEADGF